MKNFHVTSITAFYYQMHFRIFAELDWKVRGKVQQGEGSVQTTWHKVSETVSVLLKIGQA